MNVIYLLTMNLLHASAWREDFRPKKRLEVFWLCLSCTLLTKCYETRLYYKQQQVHELSRLLIRQRLNHEMETFNFVIIREEKRKSYEITTFLFDQCFRDILGMRNWIRAKLDDEELDGSFCHCQQVHYFSSLWKRSHRILIIQPRLVIILIISFSRFLSDEKVDSRSDDLTKSPPSLNEKFNTANGLSVSYLWKFLKKIETENCLTNDESTKFHNKLRVLFAQRSH